MTAPQALAAARRRFGPGMTAPQALACPLAGASVTT
jgi:hypothetical protein